MIPTAQAAGRLEVRWDPKTGRGDVIDHGANGDLYRTCFHCRFAGYTGGLVIGSETGSGVGLYPKEPIRGFRSVNVWCAQDESIWDRDQSTEYTYGWSENYGRGADGERLEYVRGRVLEAGPGRVVLQSRNEGGCYRVTKLASTRQGTRLWILSTRIVNRCERAVHFDFFTGEDPWIGLYRSSDGDVGWTPDGLVRTETAFEEGRFRAGGFYDLGNRALGQKEGEGGFSNQANFIALDPATALPDVVLFANRFAHAPSDIAPDRPLDNKSLSALNLGWTDRTLQPGEGLTIALAMGLAVTAEPGEVPRVPEITDDDWSVWRRFLVERPRPAPAELIDFAAERVELDLTDSRLVVDGAYTLVNRGHAAATARIRYPILEGPGRPAPSTVQVDGRTLPVAVGEDGAAEVEFRVELRPRGIVRFRIRYTQPHSGREAGYMVTSARRWPSPIARAVFVVRHPESMGAVASSFAFGSTVRREGVVEHVIAMRDFRPDEELMLRW